MKNVHPNCLWQIGAELGEGPVWHQGTSSVYFVDIKGRKIHRYSTVTGEKHSWPVDGQPGFIVPSTDEHFICGIQDALYRFDPANGACQRIVEVEPRLQGNRINDGFVDPTGMLWFGTMDDSEASPTGSLYRVDTKGQPWRRDSGYVITNGPAMSPDRRTLYHADTVQRIVYAFDVGDGGTLLHRRVFARLSETGYPDGMAVDVEGNLWIAVFGGARIERRSPNGALVDVVRFPCDNITKLAFGGNDFRAVYVTTARKGLSPAQREQQPLAGGLFSFQAPVGGLPQTECRAWT